MRREWRAGEVKMTTEDSQGRTGPYAAMAECRFSRDVTAAARTLCQTSRELDHAECWQGNGDFRTRVHADGSVGYCSNLGNNPAYLVKLSTGRPYNTAIPPLYTPKCIS